MTVDHEFLEDVVQKELGFPSMDDFVKQQARAIFQQKLAKTETTLAGYEAKYSMTLVEFQQRVINQEDAILQHFGILEKEDDLMNWEFEQHSLPYFRQRLDQLAA